MSDKSQKGEIILFQSNEGHTKIQVRFEEKSVWLSQKSMAELYQVSVPSVNEHLAHIFEEGELPPEATIRKFRIVQTEGKREVTRAVDHYSLEAILAVGYRVGSVFLIVSVAKNYLKEEELTALNRTVTMYLDYAEDQAMTRNPMHMADWVKKLDGFLQFNEKNILTHAGKISHQMALEHAETEFEKFDDERRRIEASSSTSDFDKLAKNITAKKLKKK